MIFDTTAQSANSAPSIRNYERKEKIMESKTITLFTLEQNHAAARKMAINEVSYRVSVNMLKHLL